MRWRNIEPDHGAVAVAVAVRTRVGAAEFAVELHVMVFENELWAWWERQDGTWIGDAEIGEA